MRPSPRRGEPADRRGREPWPAPVPGQSPRSGDLPSRAAGERGDRIALVSARPSKRSHPHQAAEGIEGQHAQHRSRRASDLRKLRQPVTGLYVFETERGGPLSVGVLQDIVPKAGERAKLDVKAHPHMLRHAAGYDLESRAPIPALSRDTWGHKEIATRFRVPNEVRSGSAEVRGAPDERALRRYREAVGPVSRHLTSRP